MSQRQPDTKGAPGKSLTALPPTRLTLISEETRRSHITPDETRSLHAVYDLIANIARRVRDEETERAA